ncbi:SDR family oxidoreductase [Halomonas sp. H10-9-1]|uniref:SDR family NAD(P)-dependent oxidoreductase n=1 Tax=Halomonas sp. H10-9-1 TaxID=2950871 RepID=UPI0032DE5D71
MARRNALITGGARGIGAASARALAADGYRVFINYVNSADAAERLAETIREGGGEAHALQADVRDDAQLEAMFGEITQHHGGVDVLVSNANMSFVPKPFMEQSWEEFSQKLNDEMHAAYQSARLAAESMRAKGFGRLVFISSTLSEAPAPRFIAHGSAKGALDSFTKYLAQELGPYGITANIVAPGLVDTDATKDAPSEFKEMIRTHTPMQKIATPDDVANTVRYLASEASGHITGTYNPVCGGAYMS